MCYAAATSARRELIFEPWPEFCSTKKKTCDFDRVVAILKKVIIFYTIFKPFKVPSVKDMKKHADTETNLKTFLKEDVYMLVKWILTVDRMSYFSFYNNQQDLLLSKYRQRNELI